jgi:hypothetical protein
MASKIKAAWRVFKTGEVVANPAAWKKGQITSNMVAALLLALVYAAEAFGYDIPVTGEAIDAIAVGLFALVNLVFTVVSTDKVGLQAGTKPEPPTDT